MPTLDPNYVYSIESLEGLEGYSLCISARDGAHYCGTSRPLASIPLDDYPADFEDEIWYAISTLSRKYSQYYTNMLPDPYHFYTQALYSVVSEDEIR